MRVRFHFHSGSTWLMNAVESCRLVGRKYRVAQTDDKAAVLIRRNQVKYLEILPDGVASENLPV